MLSGFQRLDLSLARGEMERLFDQVLRSKGRVEMTRDDGEACVLISKSELESLEKALEILADSDGGKSMKELVEQVASQDSASDRTMVA